MYDVAILGGGVAGVTAAHALRDLNTVILEAEDFIGGRTYSESYDDGVWANYGAGYFSSDKTTIIGLGDATGVDFVTFDDRALTGDFVPEGFDKDDVAEIRQIKRRLLEEQARPRDPADASLDQVSFQDWLGPIRPNVQLYWRFWCETMSGPMDEVSLYGVLLLSGSNRTVAFTDQAVEHDKRGNLVVAGGNGKIAERLAIASGAEIRLGAEVQEVTRRPSGAYSISTKANGEAVTIEARTVISALPAPVVLQVFPSLPEQKRTALQKIEYGRIIGLPVVVGPEDGDYDRFAPSSDFRADASYCETEFLLRSPTDLENKGAYFVCQTYDRSSRVIWDDPDESIQAGVFHAFQNKFPELKDRVRKIGVKRWLHGLPKYTLGRMAATPALQQPFSGAFFCGDYTDVSHTDGAARSGQRAASGAREHLSMSKAS